MLLFSVDLFAFNGNLLMNSDLVGMWKDGPNEFSKLSLIYFIIDVLLSFFMPSLYLMMSIEKVFPKIVFEYMIFSPFYWRTLAGYVSVL